ncbi:MULTISPECIES: N-acetyltransferase [unclassified Desulfovibrio]|uniref:N-acetyltransferase n=1 Tax=unclassified Desulfovibrio TaxID=2593640 RepID=UPI0013ED5676|nr:MULTISPECIES: N-acetyltransferase [unclassified Desulfovibrio]
MPVDIPRFEVGSVPSTVPTTVPEVRLTADTKLEIRPARVSDVHGMSALINQYASSNVMLARGPQYLYQHIQDYMVVTAPSAENGAETVVACGALHVLWADLAEIRSIAVHQSCQDRGLGRSLVAALVERCRDLGIPRVFVFTLVASFFRNCGFREFERENLPPIVWVECSKCPKFYRCDEIGMIRSLTA